MCVIDSFVNELYSFLINKKGSTFNGALIKRHNDKFELHGEFSFPIKITAWVKHIDKPPELSNSANLTIFHVTYPESKEISYEVIFKDILEKSQRWLLRIDECKKIGDRLHIFLNRTSTIRKCFMTVNVGAKPSIDPRKTKKLKFTIDGDAQTDITNYRLKLISNFAENLVPYTSSVSLCEDDDDDVITVNITSRSSNKSDGVISFVCAPVVNDKSGFKENEITIDQYLLKRTLDMKLKAQHKYQIYVTDENIWNESLNQLGEASAIFDLLQIKPTHSVLISMLDGGVSCSKGASFVLYNYARLTSIINTFRKNVSDSAYPELPNDQDIDFQLLDDEDEWVIIFNYIYTYNTVLRRCVDIKTDKCIIAPHQLCSFLSSLVVKFSVYYRKVKVLLKPRDHLLPKIFARIRLLIMIKNILDHGLSLLNIKPLSEM